MTDTSRKIEFTDHSFVEVDRPLRIYPCSKTKYADMWKDFRSKQKELGIEIIGTWIDQAGANETDDLTRLWLNISGEVSYADVLVLYAPTLESFPLKGALIEAGMALGHCNAVHVVCGDLELTGRTLSPLGSWICHPEVTLFQSVQDALTVNQRVSCFKGSHLDVENFVSDPHYTYITQIK